MPGLLPGWTRKGIEQLYYLFFFYGYGSIRVEMLNVLYILEALRLAFARLSDSRELKNHDEVHGDDVC